jgi:flagellar hook assembly protein FlgD
MDGLFMLSTGTRGWGAAMRRLLVLILSAAMFITGMAPAAAVTDPAVTSPPDGAVVGETVTVTAESATAAALQFRVDGVPDTIDAEAPFTATITMTGRTLGSHVLDVVACSDSVTCTGSVSDPVTVTYDRLAPSVESVLPSPFSPNGDGRRDTTTVSYLLDEPSSVTLEAWRSGTMYDTDVVSATPQAAGFHTYVWTGRGAGGAALPSGTYELRLRTSKATAYGGPIEGLATGAVVLDTVKPSIGTPSASPGTVFPVKDGYKDTIAFKAQVLEQLGAGVLTIKNSKGRVVRTISAGSSSGGYLRATWNGRRANGKVVPPGTYRASFSAQDVAGNLGRSKSTAFTVSDAYLVRRTYAKTVGAYASIIGGIVGSCSAIGRIDRWPGALGYYSLYRYYTGRSCNPSAEATDAALGRHVVAVPRAVRYGKVRVDVWGASVPGYRDVGVLLYERRDGDLVAGKVIGPAKGWHAGTSVSASSLVSNRRFRWWFGTVEGHWYDVQKYRVTLRYFVLYDPTSTSSVSGASFTTSSSDPMVTVDPVPTVRRLLPHEADGHDASTSRLTALSLQP